MTLFGPKMVQDTNLYTVHEPRGLGAMASRMWGFRSESGTVAPSPNDFHFSSLEAACGGERTPSSTAKEASDRGGGANVCA